jgi:hypothetical protein
MTNEEKRLELLAAWEKFRHTIRAVEDGTMDPKSLDILPAYCGKIRRDESHAFIFSVNWEEGDPRFGPTNYTIRFSWIMWPREMPFRLSVSSDRFRLTLPYVADGIM